MLDAAVVVTYPGTAASLKQMWGRAGRRETGLAMYIAGDDALDQFFCRHPDEFLGRPVESAILDHESEEIHLPHIAAAAYELPLTAEDADILGPRWEAYAERLVRMGELREKNGGYLPRGDEFPAGRIALRSASIDSYAVVDERGGEVIGNVEAGRAFSTVHPGAVYMHLGQSYEVDELDLRGRRALVRRFEGDWYTQPKKETETFIEEVRAQRILPSGVELNFGIVSVSEEVVAFQKKRVTDHEVLDLLPVELPEQRFVTQALWYVIPESLLEDEFPLDVLQGSLHAAEHAQIAVLPLLAMCDRWDIGGLSTAYHHQTGRPTIFIYDGHPGGVGLTRQGYECFERLTDDAARLIGECPCKAGCPSCVQSPKCGNLNEPLNKNGSLELLHRLAAN
jgi:DEAD/DEAH box helicase domain-containing protein